MKHLKKCMLATLAALMLAGALSSISGATALRSVAPIAVLGEGSSPVPIVISVPDTNATSLGTRF